MKLLIGLVSILLAPACSATGADLPGAAMVDRIEQRLSANPCIRPLDKWFRKYSYGLDHERGGVDTSQINFSFHEAGQYEFESGRVIVPPEELVAIDDRPYLYASGSYSISADRLEIAFCGPNIGIASDVRS